MNLLRYKIILVVLLLVNSVFANPTIDIINNVIKTYNSSTGICASIIVKSNQGNISGSISMRGSSFYVSTNSVKSWYDGKTQWSYSKGTNEVNITTPSASELQTTNPYSAIIHFKNNYNYSSIKSLVANESIIKFLPKTRKSNIAEISLYINKSNWQIKKIILKLSDGNVYTTTISNYKSGQNLPVTTFKFNKNLVPAKTSIVDLR